MACARIYLNRSPAPRKFPQKIGDQERRRRAAGRTGPISFTPRIDHFWRRSGVSCDPNGRRFDGASVDDSAVFHESLRKRSLPAVFAPTCLHERIHGTFEGPMADPVPLMQRVVEAAQPPATGKAFIRDDRILGFALRITLGGARSRGAIWRWAAGPLRTALSP